jgi:hypothetical protein
VESVPRLVEDEFFDREHFQSRAELGAKAPPYEQYFNLARPHRAKEGQSPLEILDHRAPNWVGVRFNWRSVWTCSPSPLQEGDAPPACPPVPNGTEAGGRMISW